MWSIIARTIRADLGARRTQSGLLILSFALAITVLTVSLIALRNLETPYESAFAAADGAHLRISLPDDLNDQMSKAWQSVDGVTVGTAARGFVGTLQDTPSEDPGNSRVVFMERPAADFTFDKLLVSEGRFLDASEPGSVLISTGLASHFDVRINDTVNGASLACGQSICEDALPRTFTVVGIVTNVGYGPEDRRVYMLPTALTDWLAAEPSIESGFAPIPIRLADSSLAQAKTKQLLSYLPIEIDPNSDVYVTDWVEIGQQYVMVSSVFLTFALSFSIFILLAAAVILANAVVGTLMQAQRDIGIFKSMGMTPGQITIVYLAQNLFIGVVALLLGVPLGMALAPLALRPIAAQLGVPVDIVYEPSLLAAVSGGVLLTIALFVLLPSWRAGQLPTTEALRANQQPQRVRTQALVTVLQRGQAPYFLVLAVQEAFAQPKRVLLTLVSIILGVMSMTFALGNQVSMASLTEHPAQSGFYFDVNMEVDAADSAEISNTLANDRNIAGYYIQNARFELVTVEHGESATTLLASVVDDPYGLYASYLEEGRWPAGSHELIMGSAVLEAAGLKLGDTLRLPEQAKPFTIVGSHASVANGGYEVVGDASNSALSPLLTAERSAIRITAADTISAEMLSNQLNDVWGDSAEINSNQLIPAALQNLPTALIGFSLIVIVLGAVGILNALFMNIRERTRVYATMKTLGFTPAQITRVVVSAAGLFALIGIGIGFPLGILVTNGLLPAAAAYFDYPGTLNIPIRWAHMGVVAIATVGLCLLGGYPPARRAATLTVTDALRYE